MWRILAWTGNEMRSRAKAPAAIRAGRLQRLVVPLLVVLMTTAGSRGMQAQGAGDGYLFGEPSVRLGIRGGYTRASAGGDLFEQTTRDFTLSKSDFSGPSVGGEVAFRLSSKLEISFDADYARVSRGSEYRNFVDNQKLPIQQNTEFVRVPLTASLRMYLTPPGRSIGRLAWVPTHVVPWVGIGGGATWYRFRQSGDFITPSRAVVGDSFESSNWAPTVQAMAGVDVSLTPRISVTGDARYNTGRASVGSDYPGFNKIDLSGASIALGLTFRL
jgi:opacity protein-like surface antigen